MHELWLDQELTESTEKHIHILIKVHEISCMQEFVNHRHSRWESQHELENEVALLTPAPINVTSDLIYHVQVHTIIFNSESAHIAFSRIDKIYTNWLIKKAS